MCCAAVPHAGSNISRSCLNTTFKGATSCKHASQTSYNPLEHNLATLKTESLSESQSLAPPTLAILPTWRRKRIKRSVHQSLFFLSFAVEFLCIEFAVKKTNNKEFMLHVVFFQLGRSMSNRDWNVNHFCLCRFLAR